jgi:hypothetical protein
MINIAFYKSYIIKIFNWNSETIYFNIKNHMNKIYEVINYEINHIAVLKLNW